MRTNVRKNNKTAVLVIVLLVIAIVITFSKKSVDAAPEPDFYKYYTHITIEEGDTLWDIAEAYMSEGYESRKDLMEEIRSINHIKGDNIYFGDVLVIPYYSSEYK